MFTVAKTRFDAMHARDPSDDDDPIMNAVIKSSNLSQQFCASYKMCIIRKKDHFRQPQSNMQSLDGFVFPEANHKTDTIKKKKKKLDPFLAMRLAFILFADTSIRSYFG